MPADITRPRSRRRSARAVISHAGILIYLVVEPRKLFFRLNGGAR